MRYCIIYKIYRQDLDNESIIKDLVDQGIYNLKSEYPCLLDVPDNEFKVDSGLHEDDFLLDKISLRITVNKD